MFLSGFFLFLPTSVQMCKVKPLWQEKQAERIGQAKLSYIAHCLKNYKIPLGKKNPPKMEQQLTKSTADP